MLTIKVSIEESGVFGLGMNSELNQTRKNEQKM